jgi:ABC-type sugar transport system permease subunit
VGAERYLSSETVILRSVTVNRGYIVIGVCVVLLGGICLGAPYLNRHRDNKFLTTWLPWAILAAMIIAMDIGIVAEQHWGRRQFFLLLLAGLIQAPIIWTGMWCWAAIAFWICDKTHLPSLGGFVGLIAFVIFIFIAGTLASQIPGVGDMFEMLLDAAYKRR